MITVKARRAGRYAGTAEAYTKEGRMVVGAADVPETARRGGVGTALYETLVEVSCKAGLPLASDDFRSPFAEAFWRKQVAKGRAYCEPGRGDVYAGPTRRLVRHQRASLPVPADDEQGEYWPCTRFVVREPCAHRDLSGVRRRR